MRYTRTHTYYFDSDKLDQLTDMATELEADFKERAPYMDDDMRHNHMVRLSLLANAISVMREPAD